MSIPSPLQQNHFHVILIWWHSPFKSFYFNNFGCFHFGYFHFGTLSILGVITLRCYHSFSVDVVIFFIILSFHVIIFANVLKFIIFLSFLNVIIFTTFCSQSSLFIFVEKVIHTPLGFNIVQLLIAVHFKKYAFRGYLSGGYFIVRHFIGDGHMIP